MDDENLRELFESLSDEEQLEVISDLTYLAFSQ